MVASNCVFMLKISVSFPLTATASGFYPTVFDLCCLTYLTDCISGASLSGGLPMCASSSGSSHSENGFYSQRSFDALQRRSLTLQQIAGFVLQVCGLVFLQEP